MVWVPRLSLNKEKQKNPCANIKKPPKSCSSTVGYTQQTTKTKKKLRQIPTEKCTKPQHMQTRNINSHQTMHTE